MASGGWAAFSRGVFEPLLAAVFPSRCCFCEAGLERPTRGPLCDRCWGLLPRHAAAGCACGVALREPGSSRCARCRRGLTEAAHGYSLGPYEGALRALVHELKYRSRRRVADRLAERIWADRAATRVLAPDAVLVPVPLHPRRLRSRGFNQAELLAVSIGRRASLRVAPRALLRRRDTPAQTGLSAAARRRNVAGAFAVRQPEAIRGRTVVLVDDVLTTGATMRACVRELSRAGARGVHILTVARVP